MGFVSADKPSFFDEIHMRYSDPERFVAQLRDRMHRHKVTQGQLVARSGLPASRVCEWVGNRTVKPSMWSMVLLDEALEAILKGE